MSGYALCMSDCYGCGRTFAYNPARVPSILDPVSKRKEPICRRCVDFVNPRRAKLGFALIEVAADAYGPCREEEVPA